MHLFASMVIALAALSSPGLRWAQGAGPDADAAEAPSSQTDAVIPDCQPAQRYRPPVDATVIDPFRPPLSRFGPGNRGLEYGTRAGQTVRAIGAGVVTFAGSIGGSRYVTVGHADGLRSSYSYLAEVLVSEREVVSAGQPIGRAGPRFHLGVRCGDAYLDPAALIGTGPGRWRARLVPDHHFPPA